MNSTIASTTIDSTFYPGRYLNVLPVTGLSESADGSFNLAIHTALEAVNPRTLIRVAPVDGNPALQPMVLLAAIIYCYARQIYASADVEALLAGDEDAGTFDGDGRPDAEMIQEFRCKNREAIHVGLATALRELAYQKVKAGVVTRVPASLAAEEASRRIIMAMFTDSLSDENE